jgi:hypothetical protein
MFTETYEIRNANSVRQLLGVGSLAALEPPAPDGVGLLAQLIDKLAPTAGELDDLSISLPTRLPQRSDEILARAFTTKGQPLPIALEGQQTQVAIDRRVELLTELQERRALLDGDFTKTEVQKYSLRKAMIEDEMRMSGCRQ